MLWNVSTILYNHLASTFHTHNFPMFSVTIFFCTEFRNFVGSLPHWSTHLRYVYTKTLSPHKPVWIRPCSFFQVAEDLFWVGPLSIKCCIPLRSSWQTSVSSPRCSSFFPNGEVKSDSFATKFQSYVHILVFPIVESCESSLFLPNKKNFPLNSLKILKKYKYL